MAEKKRTKPAAKKASPATKKPASAKKTTKFVAKKRVKAGTNKGAVAKRRADFRAEYLRNGKNAYQAAVFAGYKPGVSAKRAAVRLSHEVTFKAWVAETVAGAEKIAGLDLARTLREVARLAYADPRKFYNPDGSLKPVIELDDDTAATLASLEVDEIYEKDGADEEMEGQPHGGALKRNRGRSVIGFTKKIKVWDKNSALEKAMKHHGAFKLDNEQKPPAEIIIKF